MEIKEKITVGGIITLLLLGTLYNFIPEETDTHTCIIEEIVTQSKYCDHLSPSAYTCYPKNDTTKGNKKCGTLWKAIDRSDIQPEIIIINNTIIEEVIVEKIVEVPVEQNTHSGNLEACGVRGTGCKPI